MDGSSEHEHSQVTRSSHRIGETFGTCGAVALFGFSARATAARVPPPLLS